MRGFQGDRGLAANDSMIACLKHYAGYGGVAAGLDYSAVDVSEATFRDVFLPPFAAGVEAGALTLMSAFVAIVGGVPAAGSRWLQTEVLRGELRFEGFVVSDYEADLELIDHGYAANESDAANKALWAGVDMSMQSGLYMRYLPDLVASGEVPMARLDEAVRRVLRVKQKLGLFDDPMRGLDGLPASQRPENPEFIALARESARRSIVMLKNDRMLLPLPKAGTKIALIGPGLAFHEVRGVKLLGSSDWVDEKLPRVGRNHVAGAIVSTPFYPESDVPFVTEFVEAYRNTFGEEPDAYAAEAYDAMNLLLVQLSAGRSDREGIRAGLLDTRAYPGAAGVLTMQPNGNARRRPFLLKISGQRFQPVD